jgi:hypothetical protein
LDFISAQRNFPAACLSLDVPATGIAFSGTVPEYSKRRNRDETELSLLVVYAGNRPFVSGIATQLAAAGIQDVDMVLSTAKTSEHLG